MIDVTVEKIDAVEAEFRADNDAVQSARNSIPLIGKIAHSQLMEAVHGAVQTLLDTPKPKGMTEREGAASVLLSMLSIGVQIGVMLAEKELLKGEN